MTHRSTYKVIYIEVFKEVGHMQTVVDILVVKQRHVQRDRWITYVCTIMHMSKEAFSASFGTGRYEAAKRIRKLRESAPSVRQM